MSEKTYINGLYCKKSIYGVKLSGKAEKLIEQIKQHTNEKGYINLELLEKRNGADEHGNTHYIVVDNYQPRQQ